MTCIMPMKKWLLTLALVASLPALAQINPLEPDKSPMDVSYSPFNYPIKKFQDKKAPPAPNARILYSRPQKAGRQLFGTIIKYGEVWRLGANEATELDIFKPATVAGTKLKPGRYSLYCIPTEKEWTIIFNSDTDSWGAFSYNAKKDIFRVKRPVESLETTAEYFTAIFDNDNNLIFLWDQVKVSLPFKF